MKTTKLSASHSERTRSITARLTQGSINKSIWFLALPAMGAMVSKMAFDITDTFWVGKVGATAMAALTAGSFVVWAMYSLSHIISTGITSLIARRMGEMREHDAHYVAQQSVSITLLLSLIIALLILPLVSFIFQWMGTASEVQVAGKPYLMTFAWGAFSLYLFVAMESIFYGMGDTHTPMKLTALALILNMLLDPLLIFGIGPFPMLGVGGAALATVVSRLVGVIAGFWILKEIGWLTLKSSDFLPVNWKLTRQVVTIGLPHAMSGVLFCVVYMILTPMIGRFGTEPLAALGIGHRIEALAFFCLLGFSIACTSLVGQNLGAKQPERAERIVWRTFLFGSAFNFIFFLLFMSIPETIMAIFIDNPQVIQYGATYLQVLAFSLFFLGMEIILEGAFSGAGNTVPPMVIVSIGTLLRIPLALYLAYWLEMGILGIWWAIAFSTITKGLLMAFWFQRGQWKVKKV